MERVWDYFMRRKALLALVLLISAIGGFFSYRLLDQSRSQLNHTYITIASWGDEAPEVEIPLTGGEASVFSVMSPHEVTQLSLSAPENTSELTPEVTVPDLSTPAAASSECTSGNSPALVITLLAMLAVLSYFTYQHYRR